MYLLMTSAVMLLMAAALLFYLSNKNQALLVQPLAKSWRYLSCALLIVGFVLLRQVFTASASVFLSLVLLMIVLILWPVISLMVGKFKNA